MPYSNVPESDWPKMESCVEQVMAQGKGKEAAIRICYRSVMGKEMDDEKKAAGTPAAPETEEKCMGMETEPVYVYGATSFAELDEADRAAASAQDVSEAVGAFQVLAGNILRSSDIDDKPAALRALSGEFADRVDLALRAEKAGRRINADKVGFLKGLADKVRELMKSMSEIVGWADYDDGEPEKAKAQQPGLMLWKEESGAYRWLAVYSNHFRDNDSPPEIIASKSHLRFVEQVDAGQYPMPELWHWHTPGTAWGVADWVGYDPDSGFALASGVVKEGHAQEAENIAALGETVALSHGMPKKSIVRDPADPSVIVEHQTVEISDLPRPAAANKLTTFEVLKENDMAIPDEKKEYLRQAGLSDEKIASLEAALAGKAKEAAEAGLEHKEAEQEPAAPEVPAETETPAPETLAAPPAADPMLEAVERMTAALDALQARIDAQAKEIDALKAKELELTPGASLADLIRASVIGKDEARIRADSKLAKSGPAEAEQAPAGLFFTDWLKPAGPGAFIPGKPE